MPVSSIQTNIGTCLLLGWSSPIHHHHHHHHQGGGPAAGCFDEVPSCLDALIVYHEDDAGMLIKNGGLESAMKHLKGIRTFFILSASNKTFRYSTMPTCWDRMLIFGLTD